MALTDLVSASATGALVARRPGPAPETPVDESLLRRAYSELSVEPFTPDGESLAIQMDQVAKAHAVQARQHVYCLAPVLLVVRERKLYSLHPERFGSFAEWLAQPEIDISNSLACDIINWWRYAVPALQAAGMDPLAQVEKIGLSKLRLLVSPIKRAADAGEPLAPADVADLVEVAQGMSWRELQHYVKPTSSHERRADNPDFEAGESEITEPPVLQFRVRRVGACYDIQATLSEAEMGWLERRIRPRWVDTVGELLSFRRDADS